MPLVARKNDGETWRQAVARIAGKCGLAAECIAKYDEGAVDDDDIDAAWHALYEWDCLEYEP